LFLESKKTLDVVNDGGFSNGENQAEEDQGAISLNTKKFGKGKPPLRVFQFWEGVKVAWHCTADYLN
jgi:hypothetical protein